MTGVEQPPRRPNKTQDIIGRLWSTDTNIKEKDALTNLCRCMIKTFANDPRSEYAAEAASLAPILQYGEFQDLLPDLITLLGNIIIDGTADRNIPDVNALKALAFVLWHTGQLSHIKSKLGSVLRSLTIRLENAKIAAELQTQYHLVCSISSILDSMLDIKTSGLGREDLHEPLLKQLKGLSSDKDMRLAFAATYAYQALLGVKDDEGPYQVLWRYTSTAIQMGTKLAGAVSKMDPGAALDALPSVNSVLSAVQTLYELGENVADVLVKAHETKDWAGSLSKLSRQRDWYRALRYTELLLRAKAWSSFKEFIKRISCQREKNFLCGVLLQIETMWLHTTSNEDVIARKKLEELFVELAKDISSQDATIQAWAMLTGATIGQSPGISTLRQSRNPFKKASMPCSELNPFLASTGSTSVSNELLKRAWLCPEVETSKIFYADASIHYRYKAGKALQIERLSNTDKPLSLEKCYINLAILSKADADAKQSQPSGFSLKARLRLGAAKNASSIALETLFDERQLSNGLKSSPRRIFIRGRAGIGKSTMCKKIVDNFLKGKFSCDRFDRLIWISLRKLINKHEGLTLEKLIEDELLDEHISDDAEIRKDFAKVMTKYLGYRRSFQERTLLLLDGLDEVSSRWGHNTPIYTLLESLLRMPNVILTSRPQTKVLDTGIFDLELETVGFLPEQVSEYIEHCIEDESLAESMKTFLEQKPLIADLMRIPIQLDAFCHVWLTRGRSNLQSISTMTLLYQAVCEELGKKDILRLEKAFQVDSLAGFELAQLLDDEQMFLNEFAFQGLYNNVIEFDDGQQNMIAECVSRRGIRLQRGFRTILEQMSYIRTSEVDLDLTARSYHFLHLTFQEFFAAKHWVEHWKHNKPLDILPLSEEVYKNRITASEFLNMEKYNPRYNIFWRFVTGLVQTTKEPESFCEGLAAFIAALDATPCDELGYMHHRLLMYALNEITETKEPIVCEIRATLECRLRSWSVLEIKAHNSDVYEFFEDFESLLVYQDEFPHSIHHNLLHNADPGIVEIVLDRWEFRSHIPPAILTLVTGLMESGPKTKEEAALVLRLSKGLPREALVNLVTFCALNDHIWAAESVRDYLVTATLPNDFILGILSHFVYLLEDPTLNGQLPPFFERAGYLWQRPNLSKEVLKAWVRMTFLMIKQGKEMSNMPPNPFSWPQDFTLIDCLQGIPVSDSLELVHWLLLRKGGYDEMNQNVIDALRFLVQGLDADTQQDLTDSLLKRERYLSAELKFFLPLLDDSSLQMREFAVKVFQKRCWAMDDREHCYFDADVEKSLVSRLLEGNVATRKEVMTILVRPHRGTTKINSTSMLALQDSMRLMTDEMSPDLIRLLCSQRQLPLATAEFIGTLLGSKNEMVIELCLVAMEDQDKIHPLTVTSIAALLHHANSRFNVMAFEILAIQHHLDDAIMDQFVKSALRRSPVQRRRLLELRSARVRIESTRIFKELSAMLEDVDENTYLKAVLCLYERTRFDELLRRWMLDEQRELDVRLHAIRELGRNLHPSDPQSELEDWLMVLRNQDSRILNASSKAIACRFKNSVFLTLLFLKHLANDCSSNQDLAFKLRNNFGIQKSTLRGLGALGEVPEESLMILADGMREIVSSYKTDVAVVSHKYKSSGGTSEEVFETDRTVHIPISKEDISALKTASHILANASDLPVQFWETFVGLWNEATFIGNFWLQDNIANIFSLHSHQRPLPAIVNDAVANYLCLYDSKASFRNRTDDSTEEQIIGNIASGCISQWRLKAINVDPIVKILDVLHSSTVAEELLLQLIHDDLEFEIIHLLNNESLKFIFLEWIKSANVTELSCYKRKDELFIQRNGKEIKLNMPPSGIDPFLKVLRNTKKELGFEEVPALDLSSLTLD